MKDDQRLQLENKKKALQQKLMVEEETRLLLSGYIPFLKKLPLPFNFEYFQCVDEENKDLWLSAIDNPPLSSFSIPVNAIKVCDQTLQAKMMDIFPGYLPLRYLPCLPFHLYREQNVAQVLSGAMKSLGIYETEEAYLFFTRFQPVLRLSMHDILQISTDDFPWGEDLCIMSKDFNWLIFRSLEDEWRWGNTALAKDHFNPRKEIKLVERGVLSIIEMRNLLTSFIAKYGIDYDEESFMLKQEIFTRSNADDLLMVWKGKEVWLEVLLKKENVEWKILK